MRMLLLVILVQGCIYGSHRKPLRPPPTDPYDPFKDNEFVLLAKTVTRIFNLGHCWTPGVIELAMDVYTPHPSPDCEQLQ